MPRLDRRGFLTRAGGTAALTAAGSMIGRKGWAGANDRVRVGIIGLNGRGGTLVRSFHLEKNVEVAALCDVDQHVLDRRSRDLLAFGGKAQLLCRDMREIFDDKTIDCVVIATPNHWHALAAIRACQAGKDVYLEKPGSHNLHEGQEIAKAAKRYGRMIQCGTQFRASAATLEAMQKLKEGIIGEVYMARALCYRHRRSIGKCGGPQPIPDWVDYDQWLGPAPKEPLMRTQLHYDWHYFWEYGGGEMSNQGVHEIDKARWGLGVGLPDEVSAMGEHVLYDDDQQTPNCLVAVFKYPKEKKILQFELRNGISNHEGALIGGDGSTVGNIFYGSEGFMIIPSFGSYQVFRGVMGEALPIVQKEGGEGHLENFINVVKSRRGEDLLAPYAEGRLSAALCHLANVSYRIGSSFKFDPKSEKVIGHEEAEPLLTRNYRKGFELPDLS